MEEKKIWTVESLDQRLIFWRQRCRRRRRRCCRRRRRRHTGC